MRIVEYAAAHEPAVAEFNRRMAAGGSPWGFYAAHRPEWIARVPGQAVWREFHLAVDDVGGRERGCHGLPFVRAVECQVTVQRWPACVSMDLPRRLFGMVR